MAVDILMRAAERRKTPGAARGLNSSYCLGNSLSGADRWHEWHPEKIGSAKIGFSPPVILDLMISSSMLRPAI
jgi:hypothetical protein